jgi:type IV secretory pathway TrbD component
MLSDLTSTRLMYLKAGLFVLTGLLASTLILLEHPSLKVAALLGLAIWSFARAYYFAFYVIEHYIDPTHRYAGLAAFLRYVFRRRASNDLKLVKSK